MVPPTADAKALATEFARYLGIRTTTRMTQAQITEAICHTYNQAGVRLILIDEIHRLNPRTTTSAETRRPVERPQLPDCPIPNSFVPGTRVLMADGRSEPIEEVRVGQQVLVTAPVNSHTGARTVSRVIVGDGEKNLVEVTVDTDGVAGNATGILRATGGHPFWVDNQHRWLDAKDLEKGDRLRTPAGELRDVVNTRAWTESHKVYNLSVDDLHTYYVLAGDTPVLVHNTGLCPEKIDDAFYNPSGRSSQEQFEYHWDKHAKGRGFTR
ncbi:polymorphic toxin-type HINT domain-containing protein [Streptomyces hundungensis]|uniref:polymorphic toxin-type HINT domain-containing protein n=1 Tax=Streptomyces hundungensis TaxID=1077946 RepID=UPI0033F030AC